MRLINLISFVAVEQQTATVNDVTQRMIAIANLLTKVLTLGFNTGEAVNQLKLLEESSDVVLTAADTIMRELATER